MTRYSGISTKNGSPTLELICFTSEEIRILLAPVEGRRIYLQYSESTTCPEECDRADGVNLPKKIQVTARSTRCGLPMQ
jgi:hypothetical protein